jgi:glycosyltransferase involved in cell wall biosynthesis
VVRVLIVAPAPLGEGRIGGIANFINGFVQYMPDDFEAEIIGVAVGDELATGEWHDTTLAGRTIRFMPVTSIAGARRSGHMPTKAAIVAGMWRHRRLISTNGRVAQVHAPAMNLGLIGRHAPVIRVVHNAATDLATDAGESDWRFFGPGLRLLERFSFSHAARVYFVDRATRDSYAGDSPTAQEHLRFLPNGIDTNLFRPLEPTERTGMRERLGHELGVSAADRWLMFAGRLDQQKDPELLLRAFADHCASNDKEPAQLLVAGEGRLSTDAQRWADELHIAERVHFLGLWPRQRLAELMPAADGFVLASAFEAAPFVVLEALASGLPVAATAVGEVPSMVKHGDTGWIAEERTPAVLAQAIRWVLAQPRDEIARRCAASMAPFELRTVLAPFYEDHRQLAQR